MESLIILSLFITVLNSAMILPREAPMLTKILYFLIELITSIHNTILTWNDNNLIGLSDKDLHFVVIGILGILMIAIIYPLFKFLAKRHHFLTLSFIYVFTLIIVITFCN